MNTPQIHETAFVAPDATVIGDVSIDRGASVWFHATIRADRGPVRIGEGSNIQDNAVIHMDYDLPVEIGRYVSVGHSAIVHGATIGDGTLIGMGAIVMNRARIGKNCLIGAGALVTQGVEIPDGSLVLGSPGRVVRQLTEEEIEGFAENARSYVEEAREYRAGEGTIQSRDLRPSQVACESVEDAAQGAEAGILSDSFEVAQIRDGLPRSEIGGRQEYAKRCAPGATAPSMTEQLHGSKNPRGSDAQAPGESLEDAARGEAVIKNTTLCYAEQDGKLLMLHRTKKEHDVNRDKWIGVGGHCEERESPEDCMRRELAEETGMTADSLRFRGVVTFIYREITEYMFLFTAEGLRDRAGAEVTVDAPLPECREGELAWIPWDEVFVLPIWEGDRIFLRMLREGVPFLSLKLVYDDKGALMESVVGGG